MQKNANSFPSIRKDGFIYGVFSDLKYVMHAHEDIEVIYLISGRLNATVENRHYALQPGDFLIVCSNLYHSYATPGHTKVFSFGFSPKAIPFFDRYLSGRALSNPVLRRGGYPRALIVDIIYLLKQSPISRGKLSELGILLSILGILIEENPPTPISFEDTLERRLITYITVNCYGPICLADVAQKFSFSQSAASRLIARVFSMGLPECVRKMRINTAKRLLAVSSQPIVDIAIACGYDSLRTFDRAFAAETGMTPTKFRCDNAYYKRFDTSPILSLMEDCNTLVD